MNTAVILAAGRGTRMKELARGLPKGFIRIDGRTLIERSVEKLLQSGIERILVGTGFRSDAYEDLAAQYRQMTCIRNPRYDQSGSMRTLCGLRNAVGSDFLLLESDLLYERAALRALTEHPAANVILAGGPSGAGDEVHLETDRAGRLVNLSKRPRDLARVDGELVGISRISTDALERMCAYAAAQFAANPMLDYEHALAAIAADTDIRVAVVPDLAWCEIDNARHLRRARDHVYPLIREREK